MTPTFALDLALDGIRLLYRADGGWTVMGDVALEDPALTARLAALRAEAEAIAPGAVATELVIPPCQIRYATLPAPDTAPDDASVHAAAQALAPLDPEELVVDWELEGDRLRLALVDRVTLREAEDFAEAHRFNPVAFSARPTPDQFPRAPWFGATARALARSRAPVAPSALPAPERPRPEAAPVAIAPEALAASLLPPSPEAQDDPAPVFAAHAPRALPEEPQDAAPVAGAPALAARLSVLPVPRGRQGPSLGVSVAPRRPGRVAILGGVAAALLLAVGVAGLGLRGAAPVSDPAALLPDTPPEVTVGTPGLAAPDAAQSASLAPAATAAPGVPEAPPPMPELGLATAPAAPLPAVPPEVILGAPDLAPPEAAQSASGAPAGTAPPEVAGPPPAMPALARAAAPAVRPAADTGSPGGLAWSNRVEAAPAVLTLAVAAPTQPMTESTEQIYLASIDPVTRGNDAVMLPAVATLAASVRPVTPLAPPPPGTTYDLGENGLVRATPEGAMTPEGIVVTQGRPPLLPPPSPARAAAAAAPAPVEVALAQPTRRPAPRPGDIVELGERASFGGFSRAELADRRPAARPVSAQAAALAALPPDAPASLQAVAVSRVPADRPRDLADRATRAATAAAIAAAMTVPEPAPQQAAAAAPAPVRQSAQQAPARVAAAPAPEDSYDDGEPEVVAAAPNIPTSASVARQATIRNAIRLRDVNLIGVFGTERDRRALVRLGNGRLQRVRVGDRLDGGQIAAIGSTELRYVKGGRNITLSLPSG